MFGYEFIGRRSRRLPWALLVALALPPVCGASANRDAASAAAQVASAEADVAAASNWMRQAFAGDEDAFERARARCNSLTELLPQLKSSLARLGNTPAGTEAREQLSNVEFLAREWARGCAAIESGREPLLAMHEAASRFEAGVPALQALLDLAANGLTEAGQPPSQVYLLARQSLLLERMRSSVRRMLAGGSAAVVDFDRFARDWAMFERTLAGLIRGAPSLSIEAVEDPIVLDRLTQVQTQFESLATSSEVLIDGANGLLETRDALDVQEMEQHALMDTLRKLSQDLLAIP